MFFISILALCNQNVWVVLLCLADMNKKCTGIICLWINNNALMPVILPNVCEADVIALAS